VVEDPERGEQTPFFGASERFLSAPPLSGLLDCETIFVVGRELTSW
jgi:hypothetical protein